MDIDARPDIFSALCPPFMTCLIALEPLSAMILAKGRLFMASGSPGFMAPRSVTRCH